MRMNIGRALALIVAVAQTGCAFPDRELRDHFHDAVPADLRTDDPLVECWRNRIVSALVNQGADTVTEEILRGLSPEFFLQNEWLAGGRFEEGEFLVDT